MKMLIPFLFLAGCATAPLTEMEQLRAEQKEQERQEAFRRWLEWCQQNGILIIDNPHTCDTVNSLERGCIPHAVEWKVKEVTNKRGYTTLKVLSNTYSCVDSVRF